MKNWRPMLSCAASVRSSQSVALERTGIPPPVYHPSSSNSSRWTLQALWPRPLPVGSVNGLARVLLGLRVTSTNQSEWCLTPDQSNLFPRRAMEDARRV